MPELSDTPALEGAPERAKARRPDGSATRLQLVTEAAELGIWDWDLISDDIVYSERAKAILGLPPKKPVTIEQVRNATHPDDLPMTTAQAKRAFDPALRERKPYEYRVVHPDGSVHWVVAHGQAIFDSVDGVVRAKRYLGTIQDITPRKQMEESLRVSNARLRLAIEAGRMAIWDYDVLGREMHSSPELNRLLGFPEDADPSLEELRARYAPGEEERVRAAGLDALRGGERFFQVEFRVIWPDGSVHWLLLRAEIQFADDAGPAAVIGVVLDISEQKQHEQELEVLMHELSHRSKNLLAVVQAIARQTVRRTSSFTEFESSFLGRIQSMARSHDVLLKDNWRGASLEDVLRSQLEDFRAADTTRMHLEGPPVRLTNNAAQSLAQAIHELASNASKFGALSSERGQVRIAWSVAQGDDGRMLQLLWQESGGPAVTPPQKRGFGTHVLESIGGSAPGRKATLDLAPEGLRWTVAWPERDFTAVEKNRA